MLPNTAVENSDARRKVTLGIVAALALVTLFTLAISMKGGTSGYPFPQEGVSRDLALASNPAEEDDHEYVGPDSRLWEITDENSFRQAIAPVAEAYDETSIVELLVSEWKLSRQFAEQDGWIEVPKGECSEKYGGKGGAGFESKQLNAPGRGVIAICGRAGTVLEQMYVVYTNWNSGSAGNGCGGSRFCFVVPKTDCINKVWIRAGGSVDSVKFKTKGKEKKESKRFGGGGGSLKQIWSKGCLKGFIGAAGDIFDSIGFCFN